MSKKNNKKKQETRDIRSEVQNALYTLRDSDHYTMLRAIRVAHFLPNCTFGDASLDSLTLEQLVEDGANQVLEHKDVTLPTLERLVDVLKGLTKDETSITAMELLDEVPPTVDAEEGAYTQVREAEPAERSDIEAERVLHESFKCLKEADCYQDVCNKLLSEYWDKSGVRDPFLEELSFKQLLDIRIEYLLEKRSFTDSKVTAVIKAIGKCLQENAGVTKSKMEKSEKDTSGKKEVDIPMPESFVWRSRSVCNTHFADPLLSQFVLAWHRVYGLQGEIPNLLRALPKWITAREYVIWWIGGAYNLELAAKLLHSTVVNIEKEYQVCEEAIRCNLAMVAPILYSHWYTSLAGVGVSYEALVASHIEKSLSADFQKVLFRGLLKALGAEEVRAADIRLENYWTTNKELLEIILRGIADKKFTNEDDLKQEIAAVLPLFSYDDLKPALAKMNLLSFS